MSSFFFIIRIMAAWGAVFLVSLIVWSASSTRSPPWILVVAGLGAIAWAMVNAFSHVRRVHLITDRADATSFASRHRRRFELPLEADAAFDLVDATIRELPYMESTESSRPNLRVRARVKRMDPYMSSKKGAKEMMGSSGAVRNQVLATVTPGSGTCSVMVLCEPEGGAWIDWFIVDDGTNLENMEAISRAITRRTAEWEIGRASCRERV